MELPTKYGSQKGNEGSLHDTETTCFLLTKTSVFVDGCCCGLKQHPSEKTTPEHVDLTSRQLQRLTIRLKLRKLVKDIRNGTLHLIETMKQKHGAGKCVECDMRWFREPLLRTYRQVATVVHTDRVIYEDVCLL